MSAAWVQIPSSPYSAKKALIFKAFFIFTAEFGIRGNIAVFFCVGYRVGYRVGYTVGYMPYPLYISCSRFTSAISSSILSCSHSQTAVMASGTSFPSRRARSIIAAA